MNDWALVASEGFEPTKSMTADLQSDPFGRLGNLPVQRTCVEANALRGKFIGKSPSDKPWAFGTRCRSRTACQKTFPKLEEPANLLQPLELTLQHRSTRASRAARFASPWVIKKANNHKVSFTVFAVVYRLFVGSLFLVNPPL